MTTTLTGGQRKQEPRNSTSRQRRTGRRSLFTSKRSRLLLLLALVLAVASAVWAVELSTIFTAKQIQVDGNRQVTNEQILQAAAVPSDVPLLRLPLSAIAARVETLDAVSTATVRRDWPDGVQITVTERKPVAQVALTDGYGLIGSDGQLFRTEQHPARSLPSIDDSWPASVDDVLGQSGGALPQVSDAEPSVNGAFVVAESLTHAVRVQVATIDASDAEGVTLTLRNGDTVEWGSTTDGRRKSQVLALLVKHPAATYNVSVPDAPAWSG
jgi:cell division protein FtsQ